MLVLDEYKLAILILVLFILIAAYTIRLFFRLIKKLIATIWYFATGKQYRIKDPMKSKDWLTRAQAKQELRFRNSIPPIIKNGKPANKSFRERWNERNGRSAGGWIYNDETQLWEYPKNK